MNHTKLNFGKIVSSMKETEKNCVVIKNTYLNNKTLKEIGSMQYFSVQRLCLILLNMYSLFLCISLCASPLIITIRQVLLCEINLTYLLATETNRIHFITFLYTACFYTDPFRYQFPSFFFCGKYIHGLKRLYLQHRRRAIKINFPFHSCLKHRLNRSDLSTYFFMPKSVPQKPTFFIRIIKTLV